jgi:hypothetical protein
LLATAAPHHSGIVARAVDRADKRRRRTVAVAAALVIALGVAVGIAARADDSPQPLVGSVGLAVLVASPGVLALLGFRGRPDLWLSAGWIAFPLAFLSAAIFPVLVPAAGVFLWAWAHKPNTPTRPRAPTAMVTAVVIVLLAVGVVALFFTPDDPVSWSSGSTSGYSSDVLTTGEGLTATAATALALAAGWSLSRPRRPAQPTRPVLRRS